MLADRVVDAEEEVQVPAQDDVVQEHVIEEIATEVIPPTPTSPSPSSPVISSTPPHQSPSLPYQQAAKGSSHLVQQVLDKCSALVLRVKGLETANAAQQLEIIKLKSRVKKLERLNKLVVDQEKDAEVEGRHADTQAEIYNIDLDHSSKVLSMQEDTAAATQVAAASAPIPAAKPKVLKIAAALAVSTRRRKGVVIRDPEEELHIDTPAETPTIKDKGKGIVIEDQKPMTKKDQIEMDAEKLSEEAQEADNLRGRLEIVPEEDDDVFVEATPLAQKAPVVDYQ
nr:hypothetical protein [Tanacetum cinerariifolium]